MENKTLQDVFDTFNDLRILVIGDSMIDSYFFGDVDRISPEAPVPVINHTKKESRLGGAANVAINIKALGAQPVLASVLGNDDRASLFKSLMDRKNLTKYGIYESNSRVTTMKTRIISNNQHLLRVDEEMDKNLDKDTERGFLNHILHIFNEHRIDAIVFEDYDKGAITPKIIKEIVKKASEDNIPTLVDPKKRNFNAYKNITLFKPNFKELTEGLNLQLHKDHFDSIFKAAQEIHNQQNIQWLLVTLSEMGVLISNNREYKIIPSEPIEISDVSGAGDTIIAITSVCLASGISPWATAEIANTGGGIVCQKPGVVPIEKETLLRKCQKNMKTPF
ncbi:MAG: bifunctional ADP-heptose synthase [Bacteroidales bacterium]